ncbi:hypothetical protein NM208_g11207 [Fusarium decemcellulare]|uniref:Uncharacterized protein n=1 Tax=Fusarium decemcellulare TaxID=57161 RepID=A0ACC1RV80_9HYPO|nr:hypothetical protein NM208_g11207 [Fusarium decemcellulare]
MKIRGITIAAKVRNLLSKDPPPAYEQLQASSSDASEYDADTKGRPNEDLILQSRGSSIQAVSTRVAAGPHPLFKLSCKGYWMDWTKHRGSGSDRNPGLLNVWPLDKSFAKSRPRNCHCLKCTAKNVYSLAVDKMNHDWAKDAKSTWGCGTPLQPGEMETTVHPSDDWTKNWGWAITIRLVNHPDDSSASKWQLDVRMLIKDLPSQLQKHSEVRWGDRNWMSEYGELSSPPRISAEKKVWVRFLAFSTREKPKEKSFNSRSWVAEVCMTHKDKKWLEDTDFRDFLLAKHIDIAQIDQRTARARCKTVVMYDRGVAYGNDMTGHPVEAWNADLAKKFEEFIAPLLKR